MNLARFFDPELIDITLVDDTKMAAVQRLADLFCKKYPDKDKNEIIKTVIERESCGSTSFGRGFAFPHARTDTVSDLYIVFGINKYGFSDKSPDDVPIKAIFLILTPRNISKLYLQTLSGLANFARQPGMLDVIVKAESVEELMNIIENTNITVSRFLNVSDLMSDTVPRVSPDDGLKHLANIMFKYNISGVPVTDSDGKIVGEITDKDILKSFIPDYKSILKNSANLSQLEPLHEMLLRDNKTKVKGYHEHSFPYYFGLKTCPRSCRLYDR